MNRLGTLHILTGRDITDTLGIGFRGFNINIIWFTHLINRNRFTVLFDMSNVTLITCTISLYGNTSFLFMDTTSYRIASIYDDSICLFFTSPFIKTLSPSAISISFLLIIHGISWFLFFSLHLGHKLAGPCHLDLS